MTTMPLVTVFNLRSEDPLSAIEESITRTLSSMSELAINDWEINVVPVLMPDGFDGEVTRIDVDLWEHPSEPNRRYRNLRPESRGTSNRFHRCVPSPQSTGGP